MLPKAVKRTEELWVNIGSSPCSSCCPSGVTPYPNSAAGTGAGAIFGDMANRAYGCWLWLLRHVFPRCKGAGLRYCVDLRGGTKTHLRPSRLHIWFSRGLKEHGLTIYDKEYCGRFIITRPLILDETLSILFDTRLLANVFSPGGEKVQD